MKDYLTINGSAVNEIIINKSRFIGITYSIESETDVEACLRDVKEKYPEATHYCYGYIADLDGLVQRFSDDGEPGGTAGMPIIQVVLKKELKKVLLVVVRYFGGIKLGAGGLVRAYTRAAVGVINKAGIIKMTYSSKGVFDIDYHHLGSVEYFLRQDRRVTIQDVDYGESVKITVLTSLPWDELVSKVTGICSGNLRVEKLDNIYYNWSQCLY